MRVAPSQVTKISFRTPNPPYTHSYVKVAMRLLWEYIALVHDSVCKSSFSYCTVGNYSAHQPEKRKDEKSILSIFRSSYAALTALP